MVEVGVVMMVSLTFFFHCSVLDFKFFFDGNFVDDFLDGSFFDDFFDGAVVNDGAVAPLYFLAMTFFSSALVSQFTFQVCNLLLFPSYYSPSSFPFSLIWRLVVGSTTRSA